MVLPAANAFGVFYKFKEKQAHRYTSFVSFIRSSLAEQWGFI